VDPRLDAELKLARVPPERLVRNLYRLALRRDPEADALERDVAKLTEGTLSPATLLRELTASDEFERVRLLDDALGFARWARAAGERPRELTAPAGSDERPVEIPWCLARYRGETNVLDVGYAFAEPVYLAALTQLGATRLVGVDLAEAEVPGLEAVCADLRALPFRDREFDVVFCISTVEHVGQDNARYGIEPGRGGMEKALRELRRVGRRILITVPAGEPGDHGWFVQLDPERWLDLFRSTGLLVFEHELYELSDDGWRSTPSLPAEGVRYGERGPGASAVLCAELHPRTAGAVLREQVRRLRRRGSPT
jgi:SAM-dependent methyltransferase